MRMTSIISARTKRMNCPVVAMVRVATGKIM